MALSLYAYIKFRKLRYQYVSFSSLAVSSFDSCTHSEFSPKWWAWLFATGTFLACTLGCKMVGLLTFATIGTGVLIDLWQLLDIRKGLTMVRFRSLLSTAPSHTLLTGTIRQTFCCSCFRSYRLAFHYLPLILLGTFQGSQVLWNWRQLHEPSVPRNTARKRTFTQQSR